MQRNLLIPGRKKRIKVLKNYYLEKEANSAGIKELFFFSSYSFLSKVEAVTARHFPRKDTLMHIALLHNLSPRLEENVRSAFCGQVGVLFVHAAVRQHQSTRWPLESSTRIFICMQNSTLEGKRCVLFFQGTVCKQGGRTKKKTAGLKRRKRDVTKSHGAFLLFTLVCLGKDAESGGSHYLWHLAREAAVNINIASPPTYCKSNMQTKLRSPRSLICSGSRPPKRKSFTAHAINPRVQKIDSLYCDVIDFLRTRIELVSKIE